MDDLGEEILELKERGDDAPIEAAVVPLSTLQELWAIADAARGVVDGTANDRPISLSTLSLARHVGVEAWTLGGEPVPALLRRAALLLEEYKRFCVHDIALVHDDVGEWLILYGEWLGEAGHTAEEQAWPTDEGRAWRRRCARLGVAYEEE